jgi:hypothetical protein
MRPAKLLQRRRRSIRAGLIVADPRAYKLVLILCPLNYLRFGAQ